MPDPARARRGRLPAVGLAAALLLGAGAARAAADDGGAAPASAPAARRYTLPMLLDRAREASPSVEATRHSLRAAEAQLSEAKRTIIPVGTLEVLMAPASRVDCDLPADVVTTATPEERQSRDWRAKHCLTTPSMPTPRLVGIDGFFIRAELNLAWPVFTFGKLTAAKDAARAGVSAGHGRVDQARAQVEHEVRRAYYGLKLARELKSTIDEGKGHLDKAVKKIMEDLDEGKGTSTVTDLRRLQVLVAEVDARRLEVERGEALAMAALRALIPGLKHFDIDDEPLEAPTEALRPVPDLQERARHRRPEVKLLDAGLAARRAALDLQRASFFPDLLIVGRLSYAYTSSADIPQNAFYSNPLNGLGFGGGLAIRLTWDYALKAARLSRARADLLEVQALRRAAVLGIELEVEKARAELDEAVKRVAATRKGERYAQAWLTAVAQNHEMGLAETRDFNDALGAFFQMRLRWLQALYDSRIAETALHKAAGPE